MQFHIISCPKAMYNISYNFMISRFAKYMDYREENDIFVPPY